MCSCACVCMLACTDPWVCVGALCACPCVFVCTRLHSVISLQTIYRLTETFAFLQSVSNTWTQKERTLDVQFFWFVSSLINRCASNKTYRGDKLSFAINMLKVSEAEKPNATFMGRPNFMNEIEWNTLY